MPWVYLDDGFPDHPKVVEAGGDAAWLFVCALAYCKRFATAGAIPRPQVARLSDRRQPNRLALKLVSVGLWEETDDGFQVHDYHEWNRPAESRSEAGRKAAHVRWHGNGNAIASDPHMPQHALSHPIPNPTTTTPAVVTYEACGQPEAAADFDQVVEAVAQRQLEQAQNVRSASGWLAKARLRIAVEQGVRIHDLLSVHSVEQVVDMLEPPPKPKAAENPYAHFEDFTGLAGRS